MVNGTVIKVLGRDGSLDDLLEDLLAELLSCDILAVLGRDDDGVDAERDNGTVVVLVLNGDLSLGIRAEPWEGTVAAGSGHGSVELVGEEEGKGEKLGGLIGGIAEHDTLVTSAEVLEALVEMETLGDIWRLLLNGNEKIASLVVEALGGVVIANALDGLTDDLLVVKLGLGGDLTEDHDHTSLGGGLAGDLGEGILSQAGIEDGIRNLISDLVGVALTNGLGLSKAVSIRRGVNTKTLGCPTYGEEESALVVMLPAADAIGVNAISAVCTVGRHCVLCEEGKVVCVERLLAVDSSWALFSLGELWESVRGISGGNISRSSVYLKEGERTSGGCLNGLRGKMRERVVRDQKPDARLQDRCLCDELGVVDFGVWRDGGKNRGVGEEEWEATGQRIVTPIS